MARAGGWGIHIEGLSSFIRGLSVASAGSPRMVVKANQRTARIMKEAAISAAPGDTKSAIGARVNGRTAELTIGRSPGRAIGTFMGAKRRFGWYAAGRYSGSGGKQFPRWVGNGWDPGDEAGKPYHIGDAINRALPEIDEAYLKEFDRLVSIAFPIPT